MVALIKKYRRAASVVIVSGLIAGLLLLSSSILMRKDSYQKYEPFYNSELSYDVLFFGTSHTYNGVSPLRLRNEYGISSYTMGVNSGSVANSYWLLKRAVKEGRKPEAAVVDVFENRDDSSPASIFPSHVMFDIFGFDLEKLRAAKDLFPENRTDFEKLIFPFSEYHNRWKELSRNDFFPAENTTMGCQILYNVAPPDKKIIRDREDKAEPNENQKKYLKLISEFCKEEDIKLLFINIPYSYHPEWQRRENGVYELSEELGVPFINYMNEETDIDFDTDFHDTGHLNVAGAHKMTDILGKELLKMGLKDRRGEDEKVSEAWDELYQQYEETLRNYLKGCKSIKPYLSTLSCIDADIKISFTESSGFSEDEVLKKLISALSASAELNPCSQIMDNGKNADVSIIVKDKETGEIIDKALFKSDKTSGIGRI